MLSEAAIRDFRVSLRGETLCPGEEGYGLARTLPNAMIDRRPAVIARCAGAADVIACVHFAREHQLLVSVRGGGHSVAGKSVCDGGLMIDLSRMRGIRVDPIEKSVRAEPGLKLGEFDRETQSFGLATTLGTVSTTGIAGLTLGAGYGHLHGKYGLALDNLTGLDVVTADGRLLHADADENPDLFWGMRGGAGNLGIATSLEYQLHEVGAVFGGAVFHPAAKTKEVLRFWREYAAGSPDELVTQGGATTLPDGTQVFAVAGCYCGSISAGEQVLAPLRAFGTPLSDAFQPIRYVQLQTMFDPFFPPGRLTYTKSNFIHELSDEAIEVCAEYAGKSPSPYTFGPFLEHWNGLATRIGVSETAFPHRKHDWNFFVWSNWENPAESERNIQWTRECRARMSPYLVDDAYGNYVSDEGEASARAAYGPNYDRLLELKNRYDPENLFRMNHNVQPTPRAGGRRIVGAS